MGYRWASPKHLPSLFPKEERDRGQVRVKAGTDRGTVLRVLHRSESVGRGVPKAPGFPGAHRVKGGDRSGGALGPHPAPALSPQPRRPRGWGWLRAPGSGLGLREGAELRLANDLGCGRALGSRSRG